MKYEIEKFKKHKLSLKEISIRSENFYKFFKKRRSIRKFDKEKINDNIIKNAVLAAGSATSGANLQPWHFTIIEDKKIKKQIRKAAEKKRRIFIILKHLNPG